MAKVQNEMATKVSLDTITATNSLKGLTSAVSAATNSFKANAAMLASTGDMVGSYSEKVNGLSKAMELQQSKIDALRSRQEGLDVTTQSGAEQYQKLEKQIATATRQMASMESQQDRAKSSLGYYTSGLADLQRGYETARKSSQAYVNRLEAEGKQEEANKARMSGLKQSLSNLSDQYEKQESELQKIASESDTTSEAYLKQKTRLDETGTAVAETKTKISELNDQMKTAPTGFFAKLKSGFSQTGKEAEETGEKIHIGLGVFIGNALTNGIAQATSYVKEFAEQGFEAAQEAETFKEKWSNIGIAKQGVDELSEQLENLKENTDISETSIAKLQTKFYDMTGSIEQTKTLTNGVASLTDKLRLSGQNADNFSSSIMRVETGGNLTAQTFNRLEKQAPGLGTAMQQASGMSSQAFNQLINSGKMTSTQFNTILTKASADYKANSSSFDSTSQGALHHLQQTWADTKEKLMAPLVNVAATGLSSLSKVLEAPAMQTAIKQLGTGIANLGTKLTSVMGYVSAHEGDIQSIIGSLVQITKLLAIGAWDAFKGAIIGISNAFNDMTGKANKTKDPLKSVASFLKDVSSHKKAIENVGKALVVAFAAKSVLSGIHSIANGARALYQDFNSLRNGISMARDAMVAIKNFAVTNPFIFWITAIALVVAGFVELYKHSAKFRAFVNGIVKACQDFYKGAVKWFSQTWSSLTKGASNAWENTKKFFSDGWNGAVKLTQSGATWVSDRWGQLKTDTSKIANDMKNSHNTTFKTGYETLEDYTQTWHDIMTGKWGKVGSDIKNTTNDFIKTIESFFTGMYDWLNKITGGRLGDVLNTFKSIFGSISGVISGAVEGIHTAFVDVVRGIAKPFNELLSGLEKGINWVLDKVGASKITATWSIPLPAYASGTGGVLKDQLAMVNDGKGSNYREMYHTPDGQIGMFPAQRNMIVPLKAGTEILDGNNSARLASLMGLQKYASGSIGSFFSGIFDKGKDLLEDTDKILAHPIDFLQSVFSKFVSGISSSAGIATDIITNFPETVAKSAVNWIKNLFSEDAGGSSANPSGSGVQRWKDDVIKALEANGLSTSSDMVNKVLRQISTESGGNPNAKQAGSDPDGDGSGAALGLMQTKRSTFNANKFPGHGDLFNGYDNLLAALKYAKARYGSSLSHLGNGHGYANGGIISNEGLYTLAEGNKPEFVIPTDYAKHNRAVELLNQAKTAITGTGLSDETSQKLDTLIEQNNALIELFKTTMSRKMDVNFNGNLVGELYPEIDKQGYSQSQYQQRNTWG